MKSVSLMESDFIVNPCLSFLSFVLSFAFTFFSVLYTFLLFFLLYLLILEVSFPFITIKEGFFLTIEYIELYKGTVDRVYNNLIYKQSIE